MDAVVDDESSGRSTICEDYGGRSSAIDVRRAAAVDGDR